MRLIDSVMTISPLVVIYENTFNYHVVVSMNMQNHIQLWRLMQAAASRIIINVYFWSKQILRSTMKMFSLSVSIIFNCMPFGSSPFPTSYIYLCHSFKSTCVMSLVIQYSSPLADFWQFFIKYTLSLYKEFLTINN